MVAACLPVVLPAGTVLALSLACQLAAQQAEPSPAASGVKISGYIQARETIQEGIGLTASINRARLGATGGIAGDFSWKIQGEFRTGNAGKGASVALTDGYVRWSHGGFGVQAGQFKTPFSREYYTSLPDLETADRATVVDSLAPKRDIGVMADYAFRKVATLQLGLFNGEGQNVASNKDSTLLGVARVVVKPAPELALGLHAARYFGDSTRYGGVEGRMKTAPAKQAMPSSTTWRAPRRVVRRPLRRADVTPTRPSTTNTMPICDVVRP